MLSGISALSGRCSDWARRHRLLAVTLLSALLLADLVFAVTFSRSTVFLGTVGIGTTSPATTLSTVGNEYMTGGLGVGVVNTTAGSIKSSSLTVTGNSVTLSGLDTAVTDVDTGIPLCIVGTTVKRSRASDGSCSPSTPDGDIAENYGTEERVVRGEIVALGTTTSSREFKVNNPAPGEATSTTYTITTANVRKATLDRRDKLIGAVPTAPQILGSDVIDPAADPQLVALVGHVPVKMTLDGGDVAIGDPITVSSTTPGYGMKAVTSGRILGWALEPFTATSTSLEGMIEVYIQPQDWIAPQDFNALLDLSQLTATSTDTSFTTRFFSSLFARITTWLADASNGVAKVFAGEVHAKDKLCVGGTCVTEDQFKAMVAASAAGN
jgi:hypothetical protein